MITSRTLRPLLALALACSLTTAAYAQEDGGWRELFNGEDFTGWQVPEDGPWAIVDGTIDCDPARAPGVRGDVWSEDEFGDFILYLEWRWTDEPESGRLDRPLLNPDGTEKRDEDGNVITESIIDLDSGIYLRGMPKSQVNIWTWPVGSGEVWGYRTDQSMPAEVRAGVTPRVNADAPVGEWNQYVISMIGDRLSVILNGHVVINDAQLPSVNESGPIALQFHGGYDAEAEEYRPASSIIQFRNIHVQELDAE